MGESICKFYFYVILLYYLMSSYQDNIPSGNFYLEIIPKNYGIIIIRKCRLFKYNIVYSIS